jgi:hypothetical protein
MKSPWKYLVQLASLGRTVKEPDSSRESETAKPNAPPAHISALSVRTSDVAEPIVAASNDAVSNLDTAATPTAIAEVAGGESAAVATVDRSTTDDHAVLPERAYPAQPLPVKRRRRGAKSNVKNVAVTDAVEYGGGRSSVAQPPMTFFDELAGLDAEIRQLRRQLAEKLLLQNAQLKQMLERYDAS